MPYREVHLRRWQLGASFVVLTIAYIVAVMIATHASNEATHAAKQAKAAVIATSRTQTRLRRIRIDQLYDLCASTNETNRRIVEYLVENTRRGEARRAGAEAAFPQIINCYSFAAKGTPLKKDDH